MEVKFRVRGVTRYVRDLSRMKNDGNASAIRGVLKAAQYLLEKVKAKFGTYQQTGGKPGGRGPWPKLKYETIARKLRRGYSKGPLLASGSMRDSITIVKGGKGRISASIGSNDPKLIHHIYGAPRAGVPQRDPLLVTMVDEKKNCEDIIVNEITTGWKKGGGSV